MHTAFPDGSAPASLPTGTDRHTTDPASGTSVDPHLRATAVRPPRVARWVRVTATIVGAAVTTAVLVGCAVLLVGPLTGRYRTATVLSGSMRPTLEPGDLIVVRPVPAERLRVGALVLYTPPAGGLPVTHRLVGVDRVDGAIVILTKGDANHDPDPWVARIAGDQAWVAVHRYPHAGAVLHHLRLPAVSRFLVIVAPVALGASALRRIWRPDRLPPDRLPPDRLPPDRLPPDRRRPGPEPAPA